MYQSSELEVVDDGAIRHLIFNRPDKLNSMHMQQHERILRELKAAEHDDRVRLVAISGRGRAFCAGDDLRTVTNWKDVSAWPERYKNHFVDTDIGMGPLLLQEVTSFLRNYPKPTAALLHGYAVGAGYDYALSCDLRLITPGCQFGDPRIHRALWSAEGWSYKLPRLVFGGHVAKIAYLGELLRGTEAVELGLAHGLLDEKRDIREAARSTLLRLSSMDSAAYRSTKLAMLNSFDLPYHAAVHDDGDLGDKRQHIF